MYTVNNGQDKNKTLGKNKLVRSYQSYQIEISTQTSITIGKLDFLILQSMTTTKCSEENFEDLEEFKIDQSLIGQSLSNSIQMPLKTFLIATVRV